jgi:Dna[CI] antecedent DciA-like protein
VQCVEPRVVEILAPLWPHVVGKAIAQHSQPLAFEGGVLKLATSCPSWAVQLRRMSEEIRAEVNRYLGRGVVKKVSFRHNSRLVLTDRQGATTMRQSRTPRLSEPATLRPALEVGVKPRQLKPNGSRGDIELDPEVARILERSFTKYFSRATVGKSQRNA